ncbi:RHS repeat-associated core domain-containing protein [Kitasatospora sp. NPDC059463]|uniref:RHS repeat-associated core domain-containing protein n=1 Tax=Kitasatospora sp. NPDC059463 TaxID=3346842 RepID=UPI0036C28C88
MTRRPFDPYGNVRGDGQPQAWTGNNGYLGQPVDRSTGLNLLGHRNYGAVLGRFLTVGPFLAAGNPDQMGGCTYSSNDPVDRSGGGGAPKPPKPDTGSADPRVPTEEGEGRRRRLDDQLGARRRSRTRYGWRQEESVSGVHGNLRRRHREGNRRRCVPADGGRPGGTGARLQTVAPAGNGRTATASARTGSKSKVRATPCQDSTG